MRITVKSSLRASLAFRLMEALESRELFAAYSLASLTSMTSGKNGSGHSPQGLVLAPNGDFYGTTIAGGKDNYGTVFKIVPAGTDHAVITIAAFNGENGIQPRGGLVLDSAGNLYGTTTGGGTKGKGTIWQVAAAELTATASSTATTSIITTLTSFTGTNGSYPTSGLTMDSAENLYGYTTGIRGSSKDRIVVFRLTPAGTSSTLVTVINLATQLQPSGALTVDAGGNIYGMSRDGGTSKNGSIFRIAASSSTLSTLVSFNGGSSGKLPNCTLAIDGNGDIFGTTQQGGSNGGGGTLFKVSGTTPTLTTLASFGGPKGFKPVGNLILDSGKIYGVTSGGGSNGGGALFEFGPSGTTSALTALYSFKGGNKAGANPTGPLILNAGHFFATTYYGGKGNRGTMLELAPTII